MMAGIYLTAATISLLIKEIYLFELKVLDNSGDVAKGTMQVTVNSAANMSPIANVNKLEVTLGVNCYQLILTILKLIHHVLCAVKLKDD